jgi:hypothetical protein
MTEQPIDRPTLEASQTAPYRDRVLTKVDVAWGSNVGDQGFADPYEVAARAYRQIMEDKCRQRPGTTYCGTDAQEAWHRLH